MHPAIQLSLLSDRTAVGRTYLASYTGCSEVNTRNTLFTAIEAPAVVRYSPMGLVTIHLLYIVAIRALYSDDTCTSQCTVPCRYIQFTVTIEAPYCTVTRLILSHKVIVYIQLTWLYCVDMLKFYIMFNVQLLCLLQQGQRYVSNLNRVSFE